MFSDSRHQVRNLSDIPNVEGYAFVGLTSSGEHESCVVKKNDAGIHYCVYEETGVSAYGGLRGWFPYIDNEKMLASLNVTQPEADHG